jgi:hypothetical protein
MRNRSVESPLRHIQLPFAFGELNFEHLTTRVTSVSGLLCRSQSGLSLRDGVGGVALVGFARPAGDESA